MSSFFQSLGIWGALGLFVLAAGLVWWAGTKLSVRADELSEKTGLGRAFVGALLLGGITSLPEVATTVTASLEGAPDLAASNLLGGISMQVTILAAIDFRLRHQPLSASTHSLNILLQGIALLFMLGLAGFFILLPSVSIGHVGLNSILIFLLFLLALWVTHRYSGRQWLAYSSLSELQQLSDSEPEAEADSRERMPVSRFLFSKKGGMLLLWSGLILISGYVVVQTSEVVAEKTGISAGFAGLVLVAITTSLPEISTTWTALRAQKYDLALANIFGTNLFDLALLFVADLTYREGPIFGVLNDFSLMAVFLAILLVTIYLGGVTIRSRRQVLGFGYDSLLILVVYLTGIFLLYQFE